MSDATSNPVGQWQTFLRGDGISPDLTNLVVTGIYDEPTMAATRAYQAFYGLDVTGIMDRGTLEYAKVNHRFAGIDFKPGKMLVPPPPFTPMTYAEKLAVFGDFQYKPDPSKVNPEGIAILGDWVKKNIVNVKIPQLKGISGAPSNCTVPFHRKGAEQLKAMWQAWEDAGLLPLVKTFGGTWVPRFVRGSRTTLSNHSYGSAMDINVAWNGLGVTPKQPGQEGSVVELVPTAYDHGFQWGGAWSTRPDGMHFEIGKILLTVDQPSVGS